ncbi:MAG: PadR family transcriptional regulator [Bryobacteraceae bacterium]
MGQSRERTGSVLQGTLDLLILKILSAGAMHGYDIAESIHRRSEDVLKVEEGALYQALHRLELRGLLASEWGTSANNRRAKYYRLTTLGRRYLAEESATFARLSGAVLRILEA